MANQQASYSETYSIILNELNREVTKAKPQDVWQFCANWFNGKLEEQRREARGRTSPNSAGLPSSSSRPTSPGLASNPASPLSRPPIKKKNSIPSMVGKGYSFGDGAGSTPFALPGHLTNPDSMPSPYSENPPTDEERGLYSGAPQTVTARSNTSNSGQPKSPLRASAQKRDDSDEEEVEDPRDRPLTSNSASSSSASPIGIPVGYNLGRRTSVSAESLDPSATSDLPKTVIPKSTSQRQRIETSIKNNLLFRNLDEDQHNDVLNAMKEVRVPQGTQVIVQGAVGDFFYVVESGSFEVWVKPPQQHAYDPVTRTNSSVATTPAKLVAKIESGGSFGELALMYNAPRAATVVAVAPTSTLWALDRVTFRSILMEHTSRKRKMYEVFLAEVGILVSLQPHERAKIADALEEKVYEEGEAVVVEGEVGKNFYIIESGQAEVTKRRGGRGEEERVSMLGRGDYFGELALINSAPRAATVRAARGGGRLRVATLGIDAFNRLLGSCVDILQRRAEHQYGAAVAHNSTPRGSNAGLENSAPASTSGSLRNTRSSFSAAQHHQQQQTVS